MLITGLNKNLSIALSTLLSYPSPFSRGHSRNRENPLVMMDYLLLLLEIVHS